MSEQHTVTHWKPPYVASGFKVLGHGDVVVAKVSDYGTEEGVLTANFIVRACNAHEDLVAALKRASDLLSRYPKHDDAWKECRAALAKAEAA